ncbi:Metallo-dependent phosphatase [Hortaea werneckii]|nr:Metallo-dependent phosphatase [Hortaea werneckii]KAI7054385.1 Metallo-dependent phosphatase [Hortaea werneckii]KAI7201435.1 Metallo-dependent phosphatase [Hortaea werneckii]KAI7289460.1 Metallo-dependent phosphatase [Hortaea werneckii]KAI7372318.1 Metallo-dependent phosphatase [Hortaea werneckii]
MSDTHGEEMKYKCVADADVAIHCGDLTEESKLHEFKTTLQALQSIRAPLKLVIAGNHDFTLDVPAFKRKLSAIDPPLDDALVKHEYGSFGEARALFESEKAKAAGIHLLDEGTHTFQLTNGSTLTVFASPYTCSLSAEWGFQYRPDEEHEWPLQPGTDIAITHSPPLGVLDRTDDGKRAGSLSLFAAVASSRPQVHCFGHIHESWGAKKVHWREQAAAADSSPPTHFTSIDNDRSLLIENLARITVKSTDTAETRREKGTRIAAYIANGYCSAASGQGIQAGAQTFFVNAAIEGSEEGMQQPPWLVDIELPRTVVTPVSDKERLSKKRKRAGERLGGVT